MTDRSTEIVDDPTAPDGGTGPDRALPQDAGTYEVLRTRLAGHAAELARRAEALNARRLEVFGGTEPAPAGTAWLRTPQACTPRDSVALGEFLLLGSSPAAGTRPETDVEDVFSLHRFSRPEGGSPEFGEAGPDAVPGLLDDPRFRRDFADMYRYYRQARLLQLRRVDGRLLAVFQTGPRLTDIRVLRWRADPRGEVAYEDNQGERDHRFPPAFEVEWVATSRDDHVPGRHPHISIGGEVFVATVGGALTVKAEDDTETGTGIYTEPVDEPLQSLADAEVLYARVGALLLLRIRPYNEDAWRHLAVDARTMDVVRFDGIAQACLRLPGDQGIIFPGGYHLDTGTTKTFAVDVTGLEHERTVRSPDGENVLYVFHRRADGRELLLPYNVIRKEVAAPVTGHGHALFDDGALVVLRASSAEPGRAHAVQVWRTPYVSAAHAAALPAGSGPLERIGNADLVRGVSGCLSISRMATGTRPSARTFEALVAACVRAADEFHWLGDPELGDPAAPLADVRETAARVLEEHERVRELTARAEAAVAEAAEETAALTRRTQADPPATADGWVTRLAELRRAQGHLETLRELRYADSARIDELTAAMDATLGEAGRAAVDALREESAFSGYHAEIERVADAARDLATAADAAPLTGLLDTQNEGLAVLTEVIDGLEIADATARTAVLERIGDVLGGLNRARAVLENRRRALLDGEGRAAFAAEAALLDRSAAAALPAAADPSACDEQLGRLLLRLEDLQVRFAEFDDFGAELETKRTEIYEAFSARRQELLDQRAGRAARLTGTAERVLSGVRRRSAGLGSPDEVNTYFATDAMVARLRAISAELRALDDHARADELDGRVEAARQEAGRALRDRLDLYAGDGSIRLGRHRFAVNTRPAELTLVPHDGVPAFAITGTDYHSPVRDEDFAATRPFWQQILASETPDLYRAEYLAATVLTSAPPGVLREADADGLLALVRAEAAERYDEGYERGVHDHDAAAILGALLRLHGDAGLLRHPATARAAAQLFWAHGTDDAARTAWSTRGASLVRVRHDFGATDALTELGTEVSSAIAGFAERTGLPLHDTDLAAEYLIEELATPPTGFVAGPGARALLKRFAEAPGDARRDLDRDLAALGDGTALAARHQLTEAWLAAVLATDPGGDPADLPEAVAILLCSEVLTHYDAATAPRTTVDGLLGVHPRVQDGTLDLRLDELLTRVHRHRTVTVPAFRDYRRRRADLIAAEKRRLRLDDFTPGVMSTFVRNGLIDRVYLPLIGDALAKQIGAAGDGRRADHQGLLLLVSPPGYGKTALMAYVADRLGLVFVKVDGPSLGEGTTSLDPARAPDATARREIEKINLALRMGDNVLLHIDDIQHTSPELLQRFISLCDAQRRIEGVWDGETRTYDLRGKRFAVCMAGNPYTESGRRFRIPDMLANRADVWNLGDVLSGRDDLFALSYIENALTSNPVLAPLAGRDPGDVEILLRLAAGDGTVRPDRLAHPYPQAELDEILAVLRRLRRVQEVVLAVNRAYIASAAQPDAARTEPPFRLQGSYRDMNRLAERILPVMDDGELDAVIDDHYRAEAQTLTGAAEADLLKLTELRGTLTEPQAERWDRIKAAYRRSQALGGSTDDPVGRAVGALGLLTETVGGIETAIRHATPPQDRHHRRARD